MSRPAPLPVTHGRILALALPMTVSHVTTPLLGFVGATVIGRLGDPALLGAVALGSIAFDFLFWTFGSLRLATAGLTAQAVGRGDRAAVDAIVARAVLAGLAIGILMMVLQKPIVAAALAIAGASPATSAALASYMAIRIFAAPFTIANYAILGSTMGRGRTDLGLVIQVGLNLVNMGLTVLFVLGFGWGVAGVGWAALLAEAFGLLLGITVLRALGSRLLQVPMSDLADRRALMRMAVVNRDVMIRTAALMTSFAVFAVLGARSGDTILAANAVLENMFMIAGYMLDGFATAAETLCGQAIGAEDPAGFARAARLCLLWSMGFGIALACVFLFGGPAFIDTVTTSEAVRATARAFLPYAAATPLLGAAAFAFDGIYIGATWSRAMRNLMLLALAAYLAANLLLHPLGNAGLWIALLIFLGVRSVASAAVAPWLTRRSFVPLSPAIRAVPPLQA